ncbi:MAG: methyltransferase [Ilumatobacteraceae bacterium]
MLLLEAPAPARNGDLLDLGCGAGPIALTMARRSPQASVWAVDVNERARELCVDNARENGIANVRVAAPDDVPAEVRFATIWSNPPIRIGKAQLHSLLRQWLPRLAEGGQAVLVVQKHLGADSLATWLGVEGWNVDRMTSRSGYRLLRITQRAGGDHQATPR